MELTDEQQQQIAQLKEITQSNNEQECQAILEAANWNMDFAVSLSIGAMGPSSNAVPTPGPRPANRPSNSSELPPINLMEELNRDLVSDAAPAVSATPRVVETRAPLLTLLLSPFRYAFSFFYMFFSKYHAVNRGAHHTTNDIHDPKRTAAQFKQQLEDKIGAQHIELSEDSYAKSLTEAKSNLRYFLVVVLGWRHEDTGTALPWLKDPDLCSTIQRQNMVVWGGSLDKAEAYQVALGFKATKYPFIALVGPSPKTAQSNIVIMEVLLKAPILSFASPADLAHSIEEKAISHEPKLLALRLDRERNDVDRSIRNQQDAAYEESLARDRARAEEAINRERDAEIARQNEARYATNLANWKAARKQRFATPPTGKTCRIQIRTPSGERIVTKFGETDTIKDVYEFVLSRDAEDINGEMDEDFEPHFDFKLIIPVARTVLSPTDTPLPDEPQVWPNGTLIIEELDD